ncbi:MAG: biotin synthase BioB [Holosporales bacterium]|jgi:biotin synthase|nr:biotin synthase BioB [Holosporales bacterium]
MITFDAAKDIFKTPFFDLIFRARSVHVERNDANVIQVSTLFSIRTGGCCEDCAYCAQSIKNGTKFPKQIITNVDTALEAAKQAKKLGSSRFCIGASGRSPDPQVFEIACQAVTKVKELGLETCLTMGALNEEQVIELKNRGLDYYNHNVDTSPEYYDKIITTRTIEERLQTIKLVQKHKIKVCTGGILGIGETNDDRIKMLTLLANLDEQPSSISINRLVKVPGTRLKDSPEIDPFDFVRCVALARILMPQSIVRVSAGRETMSDELQALCFFAGASAIFGGDKLLTTANVDPEADLRLMQRLNLQLPRIRR